MKIEMAALWMKVAFDGTTLHIIQHAGRPWLAVTPLCETLGINAVQQARRLQRYKGAISLPLATARAPTDGVWILLPLEYVAWFLLTMRPKDDAASKRLAAWREQLPWHLIESHLKAQGHYGSLVELNKAIRAQRGLQSRRQYHRGITPSIITKMEELRAEGYSMREVGEKVGYSAATVCLCLKGKYPCVAPEAADT